MTKIVSIDARLTVAVLVVVFLSLTFSNSTLPAENEQKAGEITLDEYVLQFKAANEVHDDNLTGLQKEAARADKLRAFGEFANGRRVVLRTAVLDVSRGDLHVPPQYRMRIKISDKQKDFRGIQRYLSGAIVTVTENDAIVTVTENHISNKQLLSLQKGSEVKLEWVVQNLALVLKQVVPLGTIDESVQQKRQKPIPREPPPPSKTIYRP